MKKRSTFGSAFSLIELSIVLLIIGIIIAGITQSSRLVREMRLKSAASMTKGAGANNISGLMVWLETTTEGAVTGAVSGGPRPDNNEKVSSWNDINPQQRLRVNVTQDTDSLRPTYVIDGIGDLPSIKFNGSAYLASLASSGGNVPLDSNSDNFTFVAVWRGTTSSASEVVFEQNSTSMTQGKRAALLIAGGSTYGFNGESNDAHSAPYGANAPYISVVTVGQENGQNDPVAVVKVYTSSGSVSYTADISATTEDVGVDGFFVGIKGSTLNSEIFTGMVSEIMIFNRVILTEEMRDITAYLSKKYHLKIS